MHKLAIEPELQLDIKLKTSHVHVQKNRVQHSSADAGGGALQPEGARGSSGKAWAGTGRLMSMIRHAIKGLISTSTQI